MSQSSAQDRSPATISDKILLRHGLQELGWESLAGSAQKLRDGSTDDIDRLMCAASLHSLGLGELAQRIARHIESPDMLSQRDTFTSTPCAKSRISDDRLVEQARLNFSHIQSPCDINSEQAIEQWIAEGYSYFRATDGNVVRCTTETDNLTGWHWMTDLITQAREFAQQHLHNAKTAPIGPVTIEGISPPWLALAVHQAMPRLADGYWPLIHLIQREESELAEGFALVDLSDFLERTRVFTGTQTQPQFEGFVRSRFVSPATGPVIPQPVRRKIEPPIAKIVRSLAEEQKRESDRLHRLLVQRERARDDAYWSTRYAQDSTKRVLIPTCRYSTYIKHASADLARAFESLGWEARVLIEPDDHSRFSTIAYHRALLEFDPDLLVLINYPRTSRPDAFPTQTPFVCWIQDAMPHLFDARVGRSQGPRDFLLGHVYPKLFREFGYDPGRARSMPVVASSSKFHSAEVSPDQHNRFACEMAYVSHHSETPEALHTRLCEQAGDPAIVAVLHEMRRLLGQRYQSILNKPMARLAKTIAADAWARVHRSAPTPRILGQLREQYLMPILERVIRHEMLEWAAEIADRRSWRLRIYGRGWENHDKLGRFACGELSHGDDLRAAYQSATVHLHASMSTLVHQRVMECALSGGLPLCRLVAPNLGVSRQRALFALIQAQVSPDEVDHEGNLVFRVSRHEQLRAYAQILKQTGFHEPETVSLHPGVARNMKRFGCAFEAAGPEELLGHLGQACFRNARELESAVHRLIGEPERRHAQSEAIAKRVQERFTHQCAARTMVNMVRRTVMQTPSGTLRRA